MDQRKRRRENGEVILRESKRLEEALEKMTSHRNDILPTESSR
jgi:hypothetical protein